MKGIENIRELTADLGRVYAELRERKIEIKEASEIANIAGKIINGAKAEMMTLPLEPTTLTNCPSGMVRLKWRNRQFSFTVPGE